MYAVRNRMNIGDGRIVVPWRIEARIFNPSPRIHIRRSSALYPHDDLCFFRKGLNNLQLVDSAIGIEPMLNSSKMIPVPRISLLVCYVSDTM